MSDPIGNLLPAQLITRVAKLAAQLRTDHRDLEADELVAIFDACEVEFVAEFDAGYSLAQEN